MATEGYSSSGGHDPSKGIAQSASTALEEGAQVVKERAGALLDNAKGVAESKLNEQKDVAAKGIDGMAQALRDVGGNKADKSGNVADDAIAEITGSAAEGLERLSNTLRSKDVGSMVRDVESFARSQPVVFFGLAMAVGFLAVRFLKAHDDSLTPYGRGRGYNR